MEESKLSLQLIDNYLDQVGITDLDLKLELNDHISSIIEHKMDADSGQEIIAYLGYEIKNLVREIKQEINTRSKEKLMSMLFENIFSSSFFIVIFIACICYLTIRGFWVGHGHLLIGTYAFFTPLTILIYFKKVKNKISSNDYYTKCLINNSLLPFIISAGIGIVTIVASVIIYDKFFNGFEYHIIGTTISSLAFGLYTKTLFDTFYTIPKMIEDEISDVDNLKSFVNSMSLLAQPKLS